MMLWILRRRPVLFANRLSKIWTVVVTTSGVSQFSDRSEVQSCSSSLELFFGSMAEWCSSMFSSPSSFRNSRKTRAV